MKIYNGKVNNVLALLFIFLPLFLRSAMRSATKPLALQCENKYFKIWGYGENKEECEEIIHLLTNNYKRITETLKCSFKDIHKSHLDVSVYPSTTEYANALEFENDEQRFVGELQETGIHTVVPSNCGRHHNSSTTKHLNILRLATFILLEKSKQLACKPPIWFTRALGVLLTKNVDTWDAYNKLRMETIKEGHLLSVIPLSEITLENGNLVVATLALDHIQKTENLTLSELIELFYNFSNFARICKKSLTEYERDCHQMLWTKYGIKFKQTT